MFNQHFNPQNDNTDYQLVSTTMHLITPLFLMFLGAFAIEYFGYKAVNILLFSFAMTSIVVIFTFMEKMLRYLKSIADGLEKVNGTVDKVTNVFGANANNNLKIGMYSTFTNFMLKLIEISLTYVNKPRTANSDRNQINHYPMPSSVPSSSPSSVPTSTSSTNYTIGKYMPLMKMIITNPKFKENVKLYIENPMLIKKEIEKIGLGDYFDAYPEFNIILDLYIDAMSSTNDDVDEKPTED